MLLGWRLDWSKVSPNVDQNDITMRREGAEWRSGVIYTYLGATVSNKGGSAKDN